MEASDNSKSMNSSQPSHAFSCDLETAREACKYTAINFIKNANKFAEVQQAIYDMEKRIEKLKLVKDVKTETDELFSNLERMKVMFSKSVKDLEGLGITLNKLCEANDVINDELVRILEDVGFQVTYEYRTVGSEIKPHLSLKYEVPQAACFNVTCKNRTGAGSEIKPDMTSAKKYKGQAVKKGCFEGRKFCKLEHRTPHCENFGWLTNWVKSFKKGGVFVKKAENRTEKHIWYNSINDN